LVCVVVVVAAVYVVCMIWYNITTVIGWKFDEAKAVSTANETIKWRREQKVKTAK
jgi:hypothetical protein